MSIFFPKSISFCFVNFFDSYFNHKIVKVGENDADFEITGETTGGATIYAADDIKVDPIDDRTLQSIANNYNQNDNANKQMVRPWIGDNAQKPCINTITQFALYKCMDEKCIFATNSLENWFIHMKVHLQVIDYFKKENMLEKSTRTKLIKFRECAYCGYDAKANHDVIRHLEEEHHRSIFQCSLCYYRTIEMDNMALHMKNFHPANSQNEVYLCGDTREFNHQDEEILDQDFEINVTKIECGQGKLREKFDIIFFSICCQSFSFHLSQLGGCSDEYACYNSLYAHLVDKHPGTYVCPYCLQTMGLDETMITEHLSKSHLDFEEFQCLKCPYGFDSVNAIREHMSVTHPSNYLFVGARRTSESNKNTDEIQMIYVGNAQDTTPFKLMKCAQMEALNGMDPKVLVVNQQCETLQKLHVPKTLAQKIPGISIRPGDKIVMNFIKYETYAKLNARQDKKCEPSTIAYKCITDNLVTDVSAIAEHIDRMNEIDPKQCEAVEITGNLPTMLVHRFKNHVERPMVFLQIEQQLPVHVQKIIRCTFQCQLCTEELATRTDLSRHFLNNHPNKWFAARICVKSHVIESNDPQQPIEMRNESHDYFFCTLLKCAQPACGAVIGTRSQAIEHYNVYHDDIGSKIDGFKVDLREKIIANKPDEIDPYVQEINKSHQMCLFECQHCRKSFDSLDAIKQHFAALRIESSELELRFVVKRLFRCLQDNVIRTPAGMKQCESKHQDKKSILPVNMLWPKKMCGLCDYNYVKNDDLVAHHKQKHTETNTYCDGLLDSLELQKIDRNLCKFATGCCASDECNLLCQIFDHMLRCQRRFVCAQCSDRKFFNAVSFVTHFIEDHDQNDGLTNIRDDLHNFKNLLSLLSNMQVIFPNGLVVELKEIRDTAFGIELQEEIGNLTEQLWERERSDLKYLMDGSHAN